MDITMIMLVIYALLITAWGAYFLFKLAQVLFSWLQRRRKLRRRAK